MAWRRRGLIFEVDRGAEWNQSHAQVPTAVQISSEVLRVFYSSRDKFNRSRISFFDVAADAPDRILYVHQCPIADLGLPGAFDDCGMMPTSALLVDGSILLYYTGWSERTLVPYHNCIGVLSIRQDGEAVRIGGGPVLGATVFEPFFVATAEVKIFADGFHAWYSACIGWEDLAGRMEPSYHIRHATSRNGLIWDRTGEVAVDFVDDEERGIVSASVVNTSDKAEMWFCSRRRGDYRNDKRVTYKIGYALKIGSEQWRRADYEAGLQPQGDCWESQMVCYPSVVEVNSKRYMFYNGNGFGATGIGLCEWV